MAQPYPQSTTPLTSLAAWQALAESAAGERMAVTALFDAEPDRFNHMSHVLGDMLVDFSKQPIAARELELLLDLARERDVEGARHQLFAGDAVNLSEDRPALHMALRATVDAGFQANGTDVGPEVHETLERMLSFAEKVRSEGRITDVIHIGIGGSDLGPRMVTAALAHLQDGPRVHFVANLDPVDLDRALGACTPETTLVLIASKTFTTEETMTNAARARAWLIDGLGEGSAKGHLVALSTNKELTAAFGVPADQTFGFWPWVGGRFSLWSALGLPIALAVGADGFRALLAGAWAMDEHFRDAPLDRNLPVLMGLIGVFNSNLLGAGAHAVLPYAENLSLLPAYLQQLEMESNGKDRYPDGTPVDLDTCPILFGQPGTNGQHAFYQLIHQGTRLVSCDFIGVAGPLGSDAGQHSQLLAHFLAQGEAMMKGRSADEADRPHNIFPGNRPVTSILLKNLTPLTLGQLIALYEHKVFVQAVLWGINPFDQWGVELGKTLAKPLRKELSPGGALGTHDPSTAGLLDTILKWRGGEE